MPREKRISFYALYKRTYIKPSFYGKKYVLKQNVRKKVHNFDLVTPQNLGHATALRLYIALKKYNGHTD